ncbi:MAG TPA: (2Fe-2S)-binding protein [Pseudomonadales bacterium]|nr:(2Fe-2S)-binding protein [Pseudomonadales bacterium]HNC69245.1 (2Fe-2S)-binding protein [Pseudomonadales bacterium]HND15010.1 (2Fe-2S)-binding protein [Pseudomonadales bacterium]
MYICICNSVTDRDIAKAVHSGARTLAHLESTLGVGTCCGRCRDKASDCLRSLQQQPTPAVAAGGLAFALSA